jgi:AcrR family transcriptional regulator
MTQPGVSRAPGRAAPGRPPGRRGELILDALGRLLETTPIARLDIEQIAGEAGISRTRFYHYFKSKDDAHNQLLARRGPSPSPSPSPVPESFTASEPIEAIEDVVLDATERLLATVPLRDIDVDKIVAEAGLTQARFHDHFRSADDVLSKLVSARRETGTNQPKVRRDELILDALERLLASTPMSEIDVEQVAAEAGITRTRFYHYFRSKNDALAALLVRMGGILEQVYTRPDSWFVHRAPDVRPRESLLRTMHMFQDTWWPHRYVLREVADLWGAMPTIRESYLRAMDVFVDRLRVAIERERACGAAPQGMDAAMLAQSLMWCSERNAFRAYCELPGAMGWDQVVEAMTFVWLRAIYLDDDPPAR